MKWRVGICLVLTACGGSVPSGGDLAEAAVRAMGRRRERADSVVAMAQPASGRPEDGDSTRLPRGSYRASWRWVNQDDARLSVDERAQCIHVRGIGPARGRAGIAVAAPQVGVHVILRVLIEQLDVAQGLEIGFGSERSEHRELYVMLECMGSDQDPRCQATLHAGERRTVVGRFPIGVPFLLELKTETGDPPQAVAAIRWRGWDRPELVQLDWKPRANARGLLGVFDRPGSAEGIVRAVIRIQRTAGVQASQ